MKSVVNSDDGRTVTAIVNRSELVESCQCCPARPYLEIDVPHEMISVEKLTIVTISHDQGALSRLILAAARLCHCDGADIH